MNYVFEIIRSGEVVEKVMTVAEMTAAKVRDDLWLLPEGEARRRHDIEQSGVKYGDNRGWPMYCDASGCMPNQVAEQKEFLRKAGVPTEMTPDGRTIWRDRNHRRRGLKALGLHDRNSYDGY